MKKLIFIYFLLSSNLLFSQGLQDQYQSQENIRAQRNAENQARQAEVDRISKLKVRARKEGVKLLCEEYQTAPLIFYFFEGNVFIEDGPHRGMVYTHIDNPVPPGTFPGERFVFLGNFSKNGDTASFSYTERNLGNNSRTLVLSEFNTKTMTLFQKRTFSATYNMDPFILKNQCKWM
jgi:hypothetical protein